MRKLLLTLSTLAIVVFVAIVVFLSCYLIYGDNFLFWVDRDQASPLGTMNGVQVAIPNGYIYYSPKYSGQSLWDPKSSDGEQMKKKYIDSFSIAVKYPSMEHRYVNQNLSEFNDRREDFGSTDWLIVSVQSKFENLSPQQIQEKMEYEKKLGGGLKKIWMRVLKDGYTTDKGDSYVQAFNDELGLNSAIPFGANVERPYFQNNAYYWDGDVKGAITTVIKCGGGKVRPGLTRKCTQSYEHHGLQAEIDIYYDNKNLKNWRDIQAKTLILINSFVALPNLGE